MSHLKVTNLTGLDGNISNAPVKFTGDTVEFNSQTRPAPGTVVQSVVRMVRSPFSYSTGGAYYQYFAEIDCMRTKIRSIKKFTIYLMIKILVIKVIIKTLCPKKFLSNQLQLKTV